MRLKDFEQKEVINACDCKKLGNVSDLIFDECSGCIQSIIVPRAGKWCNFFAGPEEYIIPFSSIRKIGPDIILVEIHEEK